MTIAVELRDVSRHFGDVRAVDRVSLAIEDGEFFSMLGPSGSGKTTCLRLIGGFELPTSGHIFLHGTDATDLPPYERDVNTVFQDYALFPHLSVLDNVAYGLRMKGIARAARRREAAAALEQVALGGLGDRHPGQLSGGQRQRVALARALVNRPRVLLLDEPLGALDLKLREQMQVELKGLQRRLGITFIYVTHDQGEALSMSDRVAVFAGGRVEQVDRPRDLYVRPRTTFVAGFVGTANVLTGELARRLTGSDRPVSIRPERVTFGPPGPGQLGIAGSVIDVQFHGPTSRFEIEAAGVRLAVTVANRDSDTDGGRPEPGDAVQLAWSPSAMVELRGDADDRPHRPADPHATFASSGTLATPSDATPAASSDATATPVDDSPVEPSATRIDSAAHAIEPSATRIDSAGSEAQMQSPAAMPPPPQLQRPSSAAEPPSRAAEPPATAAGSPATAAGSSATAAGSPATVAGSPPTTAGSPPTTAGSPPLAAGSPPPTARLPPPTAGSLTTGAGISTTAGGASTTAVGSLTTAAESPTTAAGSPTTAAGSPTIAAGSPTTAAGSPTTAAESPTTSSPSTTSRLPMTTTAPSTSRPPTDEVP